MLAVTETNAIKNFHDIVKQVNEYSEPVIVAMEDGQNAVIISEEDWRSINETLHIYSVPGLKERILEAGKEPLSECKIYDPNEEW